MEQKRNGLPMHVFKVFVAVLIAASLAITPCFEMGYSKVLFAQPAFATDGDGSSTEEPESSTVSYDFDFSPAPYITNVEQNYAGLMVVWNYIESADGYIVLRRERGAGSSVDAIYKSALSGTTLTIDKNLLTPESIAKTGWTLIADIESNDAMSWTDKSVKSGKYYEYTVMAYEDTPSTSASLKLPVPEYAQGKKLSFPCNPVSGYWIAAPVITKASKAKNAKKMSLKWKKVADVDGYAIEYCKNSMFVGKKKTSAKGANTKAKKIEKLNSKAKYYIRMRAYKYVDGVKKYSEWSGLAGTAKKTLSTSKTITGALDQLTYSYKAKKKYTAKVKVKTSSGYKYKKVKKYKKVTKTKALDINVYAKKQLGAEYDVMQGGCSDGTYMYFCMLNKNDNTTKILKMSFDNCKIESVSAPLNLDHGNGVTYNPNTRTLFVCHAGTQRRMISEIDPVALTVIRTIQLQNPPALVGATPDQLESMIGICGIAYSPEKNMYVGLLSSSYDLVLMDSYFNIVRYIPLSKKKNQVYQGISLIGDYIVVAESRSSDAKPWNILSAYNWDGSYASTTRLQKTCEVENVFMVDKKLYTGFYHAYKYKGKYTRGNYAYEVTTY